MVDELLFECSSEQSRALLSLGKYCFCCVVLVVHVGLGIFHSVAGMYFTLNLRLGAVLHSESKGR